MRGQRPALTVCALVLLLAAPGPASALGDTTTSASGCSVAAGRDARDNSLTCNFGLTPEQVRELTEAAARGATGPLTSTIVDLAQRLGITADATRTLLRIVGEQDVPLDRLSETLNRIAQDYRRLQDRVAELEGALTQDNVEARAQTDRARAAIAAGDFATAHAALRAATAAQIAAADQARRVLDQAQAAVNAQLRGAAASTAAQADLAMTEGRYRDAAALFDQAATLVPAAEAPTASGYRERSADAFYRAGEERADNDAFRMSIDLLRRMLPDRSRDPLGWARIQMNLGNALNALGQREPGTARLEQAVVAYRDALRETTRDRNPLGWAITQMNLGNALADLGRREPVTARLEQALVAYRDALQETTRDLNPIEWARTQTNLGRALADLGRRDLDTTRLEEAVTAFDLGLAVLADALPPSAVREIRRHREVAFIELGWSRVPSPSSVGTDTETNDAVAATVR